MNAMAEKEIDGGEVEQYRHECEVRFIAGWKTEDGRPDYDRMQRFFDGVAKTRGAKAMNRLRDDVREELKRRAA